MHMQIAAGRYSAWADLDAIVRQEVDALSSGADKVPAAEFASDDDFIAQVVAYLREREDADSLMERLCSELAPPPIAEPVDLPEEASAPQAAAREADAPPAPDTPPTPPEEASDET